MDHWPTSDTVYTQVMTKRRLLFNVMVYKKQNTQIDTWILNGCLLFIIKLKRVSYRYEGERERERRRSFIKI